MRNKGESNKGQVTPHEKISWKLKKIFCFFASIRRGDELNLHVQFGMFPLPVRVASVGGIP